ncbi:MAG: hypothetical protein AAGF24_03250 [Cyanobacteria bacterium P01_H01_bin.121]
MEFIELPPAAEFVDAEGVVRPIYKCVATRFFEFFERVERIQQALLNAGEDSTWKSLYKSNIKFQHDIYTCLQMCRIDLDWVSFDHIEQFLFFRVVGEQLHEGLLVELNRDTTTGVEGSKDSLVIKTLPRLIASLSLRLSGMTEALSLAQVYPLEFINQTLADRHALLEEIDPKLKQAKRKREALDKVRARFDELMDIPTSQLEESSLPI